MLINGLSLSNYPVLSLHVSGEIARVAEPIIDPNSLKVIGFQVDGPLIRDEVGSILPIKSVREFSRLGIIVDSIDEFVNPDDVVKIRDILKLNFSLVGLRVVTKKGAKLGKVSGYTIDVGSWQIQQLIVQRPLFKSFLDPELTISRQMVIEINDYEVIVKDEHDKPKKTVKSETPADFVPNFINPFREPDFAAESKTKTPE